MLGTRYNQDFAALCCALTIGMPCTASAAQTCRPRFVDTDRSTGPTNKKTPAGGPGFLSSIARLEMWV